MMSLAMFYTNGAPLSTFIFQPSEQLQTVFNTTSLRWWWLSLLKKIFAVKSQIHQQGASTYSVCYMWQHLCYRGTENFYYIGAIPFQPQRTSTVPPQFLSNLSVHPLCLLHPLLYGDNILGVYYPQNLSHEND
ncbi:hypothetical protein S245_011168 [Arachis hypogaea]